MAEGETDEKFEHHLKRSRRRGRAPLRWEALRNIASDWRAASQSVVFFLRLEPETKQKGPKPVNGAAFPGGINDENHEREAVRCPSRERQGGRREGLQKIQGVISKITRRHDGLRGEKVNFLFACVKTQVIIYLKKTRKKKGSEKNKASPD